MNFDPALDQILFACCQLEQKMAIKETYRLYILRAGMYTSLSNWRVRSELLLGGDAVHTSSCDGAPAVSSWLFSKGAGLGSLLTDQGQAEPEKYVLKLAPS